MENKPIIFLKAHVDTYTRKDGVVVQAHDTKVQAARTDIGGGLWKTGHKARIHAPGHAFHGRKGEITGPGHQHGYVNMRGEDCETHSVSAVDLRPAAGHSWPLDDGTQAKTTRPAAAPSYAARKRMEADMGVKSAQSGGEPVKPARVDAKHADLKEGDTLVDEHGNTHEFSHLERGLGRYMAVMRSGHKYPTKGDSLPGFSKKEAPSAKPKRATKPKEGGKEKPALDPHPNVIGKAENVQKHQFDFDGKTYHKTGKEGHSMHDNTAVAEYEHPASGHRVWKDESGRVHADSHEEARKYRKGK